MCTKTKIWKEEHSPNNKTLVAWLHLQIFPNWLLYDNLKHFSFLYGHCFWVCPNIFSIFSDPKSYVFWELARQFVYTIFIAKNHILFHFWWRKNLVKISKIRKILWPRLKLWNIKLIINITEPMSINDNLKLRIKVTITVKSIDWSCNENPG